MLKTWNNHNDYLNFVKQQLKDLTFIESRRFESFKSICQKLETLNLDTLFESLSPYYSTTGRPAKNQPEIFRSFILMILHGEVSMTKWVKLLKNDFILATLSGCSLEELPPLGSYYDFINRLWPKSNLYSHGELLPYNKNHKRASKPQFNEKLPNRRPGVVRRIKERILNCGNFDLRPEKLLQELFTLLAVIPSAKLGLIPYDNITLSGDGTALHCHSYKYGNKVCDCRKKGIFDCHCDRKYSNPEATNGWDSYLKQWFHGYMLYPMTFHNPDLKIDLPVYLRLVQASRHDSVTGIVALSECKELLHDFSIQNICFDSANDNYSTYELCQEWNIIPFIDLNGKTGSKPKYPTLVEINKKGIPICIGGHQMVHNGYCKGRKRHKWRCPLKMNKVSSCSKKEECSPSKYGRVIYTKPDWDIRLFPVVARGSKQFIKTYNQRTAAERINNRLLNDYNLESMRIRSKKRYSFFSMIIGICIHLDARFKVL